MNMKMNKTVGFRGSISLGLALVLGACPGDDGEGLDTDGDTDTDSETDASTATDSATTAPTATNTQTASDTIDSDSDSDSNTSTDPSTTTDSAGTDSAGTDSAGTDSAGTDSAGTDGTDGTDGTGTDGTGTTGAVGVSVSGTFSRSVGATIYAGNDGIGDAYLGLLEACEQEAADVGGVIVMDADLSNTSNEVPFTIEGIPDGTWYLAGFFDDNENADPNDPAPDSGDFVTSENLGIGCVEVVVAGEDVTDVELVYNFTNPF